VDTYSKRRTHHVLEEHTDVFEVRIHCVLLNYKNTLSLVSGTFGSAASGSTPLQATTL